MKKNELLQYIALKKEIPLLDEQLRRQVEELRCTKGLDVVRGSSPEFPYVLHNLPVGGWDTENKSTVNIEYKKTIKCLERRIKQRQRALRKIERYISSIKESELRQIFILRYLEGLSWEQVARNMGEGFTADAVRMKHNRSFNET